jgi:hypothetical protein
MIRKKGMIESLALRPCKSDMIGEDMEIFKYQWASEEVTSGPSKA